jgi:ABC-type nitrate/sulfonate/bicarbonate transport system substrate-binding protein
MTRPDWRSAIKRHLAAALAALTVIAVAAGCGDSDRSSSGGGATAGGLTTVKVGTQPYFDYQFFKVAHQLGIDKEFGLNLVDVPEPGQTAYPQLARGDIDIAASCESCALPAIANFPKLRNFMITNLFKGFVLIGRAEGGRPEHKTHADFLRENGGDKDKAAADFVATLKGRSFAINPAADGSLLGALLEHGGLTPDAVKVISFPDEAKAALAFISGAGDYYFGSLPQELRMLTSSDLKGRFVEAGPAELFPLNYANFAATSDWLASHEDTATRLVAVWFRVTRYLYEQPERLLGIVARELQSQTGGLLSNDQTKLALTKFMYFAPFEKAYETYFDSKSPTWEAIALEELYRHAAAQGQIPAGTEHAGYEVSAKYFDLLTKRPDLVAKIKAPLQ